jgi:hypothetical protein
MPRAGKSWQSCDGKLCWWVAETFLYSGLGLRAVETRGSVSAYQLRREFIRRLDYGISAADSLANLTCNPFCNVILGGTELR